MWAASNCCQARNSGAWGGEGPWPFFENQKSALILEKKGPDIVSILRLNVTIQNVILRVSRKKNSEIFSCEAFFS